MGIDRTTLTAEELIEHKKQLARNASQKYYHTKKKVLKPKVTFVSESSSESEQSESEQSESESEIEEPRPKIQRVDKPSVSDNLVQKLMDKIDRLEIQLQSNPQPIAQPTPQRINRPPPFMFI